MTQAAKFAEAVHFADKVKLKEECGNKKKIIRRLGNKNSLGCSSLLSKYAARKIFPEALMFLRSHVSLGLLAIPITAEGVHFAADAPPTPTSAVSTFPA